MPQGRVDILASYSFAAINNATPWVDVSDYEEITFVRAADGSDGTPTLQYALDGAGGSARNPRSINGAEMATMASTALQAQGCALWARVICPAITSGTVSCMLTGRRRLFR
jgi:hypothetical protein